MRPHLEGPQRQKDAELLERGQRRPRGAGRPGRLRCGASRELGVCGRGNDFKLNRAGSGEVLRRNFHSEGGEAVGAPSLGVLKARLNGARGSPDHSVIL